MTPYVVVKAFTGPLVDRIGPRVVSWTTDLVSAAAAAVIPLLHAQDLLSIPLLLVLVAVIGAARGPGDLAKEVMVPEAAERGRVPLERATGLSGVIERLASTVGPAAGGAAGGAARPVDRSRRQRELLRPRFGDHRTDVASRHGARRRGRLLRGGRDGAGLLAAVRRGLHLPSWRAVAAHRHRHGRDHQPAGRGSSARCSCPSGHGSPATDRQRSA